MSTFSYQDYQEAAKNSSNGTLSKVGFFKLKDDGDEALVRFHCSSVEDLIFASVHSINAGGKWIKVCCADPLAGRPANCKLCEAASKNAPGVGKASKKVYLKMLVSYKDKTTGGWSEPLPVIWERPASFSREIATKLANFGDLTQSMFKITRNGVAGDMKTTYSLDYAVPAIFKPEMIPADFSAFNTFNIARHSYWEKTPEEINIFLTTGAFPETMSAVAPKAETTYVGAQQYAAPQQPVYAQPQVATPAPQATVPFTAPTPTPAPTTPVASTPVTVAQQPVYTQQAAPVTTNQYQAAAQPTQPIQPAVTAANSGSVSSIVGMPKRDVSGSKFSF